ncbi:MAG: hypothetical protein ACOCYU_07805 [Brevefilum sp.]
MGVLWNIFLISHPDEHRDVLLRQLPVLMKVRDRMDVWSVNEALSNITVARNHRLK